MNFKRKSPFGRHLRTARLERGLTQPQLAARARLYPRTISSYETGKTEPSLERLRVLCQGADLSADYLLGLSEHMSTNQQIHDAKMERMKDVAKRIAHLCRRVELPPGWEDD